MGNKLTSNLINYRTLQEFHAKGGVLINVLDSDDQDTLISGTCSIRDEVDCMNKLLSTNKEVLLIVYGKNSCDARAFIKAKQLKTLGFTNVHIYSGGLFEWLLLGEIFGQEEFSVTTRPMDILKYGYSSSSETVLSF